MAANFFKWKRPCFLPVQQVFSFGYRIMSLVCKVVGRCLRCIYKPASLAYPSNWNISTSDICKWTYSQNTVDLNFSSHNCDSSNMAEQADADGSGTMQSQIWKRMVSFKRKLLGDSSVLPSAILEMVSKKSPSVLAQQYNSVEMPDYCGTGPKHPKLEQSPIMTVSDSTMEVISEDCSPQVAATDERHKSPDCLERDALSSADELFALFDSDHQNEASTHATPSRMSEFLFLLKVGLSIIILLHSALRCCAPYKCLYYLLLLYNYTL